METIEDLEITSEGDVAIVHFKGACICDTERIANASTRIKAYIDTHRPKGLLFDFAGVKFFSSQVLGVLLEARARVTAYAGHVAVSSLSPQLERVFRITNLDKIFTLHPDRPTAIKQLTASSANLR